MEEEIWRNKYDEPSRALLRAIEQLEERFRAIEDRLAFIEREITQKQTKQGANMEHLVIYSNPSWRQ